MHKNMMHVRDLGAGALTGRPGGGVAGGLAGLGVGVGVGPGGMITGNEVKPHQCQQCLKSFSSNHQLVQHIRVHTGEKPYKCSYCDRRFKQLSHVQQHTRLHTGKSLKQTTNLFISSLDVLLFSSFDVQIVEEKFELVHTSFITAG